MSLYKRNQNKRGFTLVELLLVIGIIGILSSIVLANLGSARGKARDAQKILSVKQVQNALELYYSANSSYVSSGDAVLDTALNSFLVPNYISALPTNPSAPYRYFTASWNPAPFYAIYVPYEQKTPCYVCAGSAPGCQAGQGYWGVNICQ